MSTKAQRAEWALRLRNPFNNAVEMGSRDVARFMENCNEMKCGSTFLATSLMNEVSKYGELVSSCVNAYIEEMAA